MKDIKTFIIGFLTCACMFLIMGQTNKTLGDIKVKSINLVDDDGNLIYITPKQIEIGNSSSTSELNAHYLEFKSEAQFTDELTLKSCLYSSDSIVMDVGNKVQSNFHIGTSEDGKETWLSHWNDGKENHLGAKP